MGFCEICGQSPCLPRCPCARPDRPIYACAGGCEGIFEGERYLEFDGAVWCEPCFMKIAGKKGALLWQTWSRPAWAPAIEEGIL
ncbi:MAG: hypothetical protein IJL15_06730 [Clostridia bacterium]|nr:hypothetical protein [Clostridia bacterium]